MTRLDFKRTTKDLGAESSADMSVGYGGMDVWEDVPMTNDQARHDLPEGVTTFMVRCMITGAAGGVVELELKQGDKVLKPSFKREIEPTEAGQTFPEYRMYTL